MRELDRFNCEQVFKRLDDYLDRELNTEETELIKEHLEICQWCADTYEFQAEVLVSVRERVQRVAAPPQLRDRIAAALQRARAESTE